MANRIHKHIIKAISKRKEQQQGNETTPAPSSDDTQLEQRLDQIIEAKVDEPVEPEEEIIINEDSLKLDYITLFNKNIDAQKKTQSPQELDTLQLAVVQDLVNKYCPKKVKDDVKDYIASVCNSIKDQELKIHGIYLNIEKQRQLLSDFILELKKIPDSETKNKTLAFIEKKIQTPSYAQIKEDFNSTVSKGKYFTDEDVAIRSLLNFLRQFVMLNNYEYGLISDLKINNPTITNPYQTQEMAILLDEIETFSANHSTQGLDKFSRFIHHSITYEKQLVLEGNVNQFLCLVTFDPLKQKLVQTVVEDEALWNELEQNEDFKNDELSRNEFQTMIDSLSHYQESLNEYGNLKIQLLIVKNDFTVINQIKDLYNKINEMGDTFSFFSDLNNYISALDERFNLAKEAFNELIELLENVDTNLKHSGVDEYGIQSILLFRIVRGDFFTLKDRNNLVSAIFDIHDFINPIMLVNGLIDNFNSYTEEKQEESMVFLKNYLLLDTGNNLINVKYEKSELIDKIDLFVQYAIHNAENAPRIEALSNEISDLLVQKIVDKTNAFSMQMDLISKGEVSQQELAIMLNTIAHEIPNSLQNKTITEEFVLKVNFILEAPNLLSENTSTNEAIINAVNEICMLLQEKNEYAQLAETITNIVSQISPASSDTSMLALWDGVLPNAQHFDFNKTLYEIIDDNKLMIENEKSLHSFVDALESGFIYHFSNINLSELKNLAWRQDKERIKNSLMPKALDIRYYYQYFNLVVDYVLLVLSTQIEKEGVDITARESLIEVKKIHDFIEKATLRAIDKGAIATAKALNTALNTPAIKRLGLAKLENETQRNTKIDNSTNPSKLSRNVIYEQEGIPYLGTLLDQIVNASNRKTGSEFEKRVLVGRILQIVEEKKHSIRDSSTCYDFIEQMIVFMSNADLILPPTFKKDIILESDKVMSLINNASEFIKPDNYKTYDINDFHTLPGVKNQLLYWLNRMEDFHLKTKQPEAKLTELILAILETDDALEHFSESLDILNIINEISNKNNRVYKNYDHDLHLVLSSYLKKISALIKEELSEPSESLSTFFNIFHKNEKIKKFMEKDSAGHNPFSAQHNLKEVIDAILKQEKKYSKAIELANETQGQQAYSQLLLRVLEGETQSPLIQLGNLQETSYTTTKTLLPESEFPVPQAEPEHPDYIGINRTMDFNPDIKYRSTLDLFASTELKKDFMQSFAWALDNSAMRKLELIRYSPGINLVAIDHAVDPHLQLNLINYVLLSLDCIGKLAGPTGEYSLQNFNRIKVITDSLQEVALMLTYVEIDNEILTTKIDHMIYKMILSNNELHDMLSQSSAPIKVLPNEDLNTFCHINEYLAHKLLGISYQKSILSPMDPFNRELDSLNAKTKEDLLRHSGIDVSAIAKLSRKDKTNISPDANKE